MTIVAAEAEANVSSDAQCVAQAWQKEEVDLSANTQIFGFDKRFDLDPKFLDYMTSCDISRPLCLLSHALKSLFAIIWSAVVYECIISQAKVPTLDSRCETITATCFRKSNTMRPFSLLEKQGSLYYRFRRLGIDQCPQPLEYKYSTTSNRVLAKQNAINQLVLNCSNLPLMQKDIQLSDV